MLSFFGIMVFCLFWFSCWYRVFEIVSASSFFKWQAEVNYLGQLRHENLVKLIGYCDESENRLLVYEHMSKGSLENHLFRSELAVVRVPLNNFCRSYEGDISTIHSCY